MSGEEKLAAAPPVEGSRFRAIIGAIALVGGLLGFGGLYVIPIPEGNREPLLLALGLVLGWGSTVISYEFGSSPAGRKAAEAGLRKEGV
ncbi:hypothetical protein [Sphingosinicella sp. BN140058]|uniref:hypothetical protein n=1 Tax=Sphingosinicella sp. BN140058 TaxID=1892855 RepID=UPI0010119543|nr:hypothetical protein [Sphingosinicella sp. BN140058]QAY77936.1 hypothetical protein ETR14_16450 [Sphingosinicella sp. BN140058]